MNRNGRNACRILFVARCGAGSERMPTKMATTDHLHRQPLTTSLPSPKLLKHCFRGSAIVPSSCAIESCHRIVPSNRGLFCANSGRSGSHSRSKPPRTQAWLRPSWGVVGGSTDDAVIRLWCPAFKPCRTKIGSTATLPSVCVACILCRACKTCILCWDVNPQPNHQRNHERSPQHGE